MLSSGTETLQGRRQACCIPLRAELWARSMTIYVQTADGQAVASSRRSSRAGVVERPWLPERQARAAPAMAAAVFPRPLALAKREEGGEIWSSGSWMRREEARAGPRGRRSAQGLARRRRRTGSGGGRWKEVVSPQRRFCGFFVSRFARGRRSFT